MQELEIEKMNETLAIIPKEILSPYFLRYDCQLINQAKEKEVSKKMY